MKKFVVFVFVLINSCCVFFSADEYEKERQRMVKYDIVARGIKDPALLKAMDKVPRHRFVPPGFRHQAYADHPLPIAEGQTISQPYVVALMTDLLELKPGDRVLEIGTGSGYQAAVLAEIVKEVYSIEIRKPLADGSRQLLQELGYRNVKVKYGDGYFGWPEHAPFDAIIITAAANHIPPPLIKQLKEGGRFILPLGSTVYYQMLTLVKKEDEEIRMKQFGSVRFVPMTGKVRE
jgi:protein-L-isoaspartate(D-aspartate) O-methyltransferase